MWIVGFSSWRQCSMLMHSPLKDDDLLKAIRFVCLNCRFAIFALICQYRLDSIDTLYLKVDQGMSGETQRNCHMIRFRGREWFFSRFLHMRHAHVIYKNIKCVFNSHLSLATQSNGCSWLVWTLGSWCHFWGYPLEPCRAWWPAEIMLLVDSMLFGIKQTFKVTNERLVNKVVQFKLSLHFDWRI